MTFSLHPNGLVRIACSRAGGKLSVFVVALASVTPLFVGYFAWIRSVPVSRWLVAVILPPLIGWRGYRSKSLDLSGAYSALAVGFTLAISHNCFTAALLTFFFTASRLTKFKQHRKRKLEADFREGGQRNCIQVFSNGFPAATAAATYLLAAGGDQKAVNFAEAPLASWASLACLTALAGCCGDTWASEVGSVVGSQRPRLVTTWKHVPRGTNGGVTLVGTLASCAGGLVVGLSFFVAMMLFSERLTSAEAQWPLLLVGAVGGFVCSVVDSLLGATVQFSGLDRETKCVAEVPREGVEWICGQGWLDNHAVNFLSSSVTALVLPSAVWYFGFFG